MQAASVVCFRQEEAGSALEQDVEQRDESLALESSDERTSEKGFSFPDVKIDLKFLHPESSTKEAELTSIVPPMDSRKTVRQVQIQPAAIRRKERRKLRNEKKLANKKNSGLPAVKEVEATEAPPTEVNVVVENGPSNPPELAGNEQDETAAVEEAGEMTHEEEAQLADDEPDEEVSTVAEETLNAVQCLVGDLKSDYVPLYALPVCGPYSAMSNFTYKVKLTPGTTKKSSAVKAAIHLFLQDKTVGGVSKDLLKVIREQDLSRNIPGKVKVSAPHLSNAKKR
ncbi:hypothetical protein D918_03316 [Trichuris suis]|nr:hypothetical protein D918_03316 [Trichuris suis]